MSIQEYRQFIAAKARSAQMQGFDPARMNYHMKAHQDAAVDFALRRGSAALFLDAGLGKSLCELEGNVLRNFRNAKGPNDEKHVCPLQLDVIRKCLRLYSRPGDVVLDPFNGIGSTGYEAVKARRKYLGFELKPEYAAQANLNLQDAERHGSDLFAAE